MNTDKVNTDKYPEPAELRRFQVKMDAKADDAIVIAQHFRVAEETGYLYFYKDDGKNVAAFRYWNSVIDLGLMKDSIGAVWGRARD
jgi:hypothetical protein